MGFFANLTQGTVRASTWLFMSNGNSIATSQRARDAVTGTVRPAGDYTQVARTIDGPTTPTVGGTAASAIQSGGGAPSAQQQQINDEFFGRGNITGDPNYNPRR